MHNLIKKIIIGVVVLIGVLLLVIGVMRSEFGNIKKFDSGGKSARDMMSNFKPGGNGYSTSVSIGTSSIANLGDFTFNISSDKKLIANISIKYKQNGIASWFSDDEKIKNEIIKKGTILRDAVINTMIGNTDARADSKKMRTELKNSINSELVEGQIEEVYFNKFIIQ